MPFANQGTLTTDKRTVAVSTEWATQTDWEAYQSKNEINITNGTLKLALITTDSVTSRPDDDSTFSDNQSRGLVIVADKDYPEFSARISKNTSTVEEARLYDYSQSTYVETVDISSLVAGDSFTFTTTITAGNEYGIELRNTSSAPTFGFASSSSNYPYTGEDFDITGSSQDGVKSTSQAPAGVNDIGNV